MKKHTQGEIDKLVVEFTNKTLSKEAWTHEAHLIVAIWHTMNHDFQEALNLVKVKIKAYNESVGTANTEDAGYHETLTIFWMMLTKNYVLQHSTLEMEEVVSRFLNSEKSQSDILLSYYTKAILFSKEARRKWMNGNLEQIKLVDHKTEAHFDLTDEVFKTQFQKGSFSPNLFNHEAHMRLTWLHLKEQGKEAAIESITDQLLHYVALLGARAKFNKTLTVAAIKVVNHFMEKSNSDNFFDFMLEFPRLKTNFKDLISHHYGFDIYNSEKAKRDYLEPDLLPFE